MPRQDDAGSESEHGKIPKSTFEIYRAEGDSQFRNKSFLKAIECYTQALEMKPGDQYCLVNRSKCYLNEGNIAKALADAEESLKEDAAFHKGIFQKAEVLYFKGDFENALVFYHRGHKLRPEMEEFRLGIQKAEEAINNSVGDPSVIKLRSDGDLSFFYAAEEKKKPAARSSYQKPKKEDSGPKRAQRNKAPADSKTIKKMLGDLYADREYLEKLLREESAKARKTEHSEKIQDLCIEGLNYLDSRSEFWQQQKPLYSRKKSATREAAEKDKSSAAKYVIATLEEIDNKQTAGEHEAAIKQATRLLRTVEKWSPEDLQNREEIRANLHSLIGNSQFELERYDQALVSHQADQKIGEEHELEESQARSRDNIGRVLAKQGHFSEAIQVWEQRLETSKSLSPMESTWLHHEISRCYLELKEFNKAKELAEKALSYANQMGDNQWLLNTNVLVAQCEVRLKNYASAAGNFDSALEHARIVDNALAIDAINRAIQDVNQKLVEEEKHLEEERQAGEQGEGDAKPDEAAGGEEPQQQQQQQQEQQEPVQQQQQEPVQQQQQE
ncbi:hypothetical protein BOX15_Mlig006729g2 [Macrostomum lignano]|uniref:Outer dynein arm-docking complex subunit 4 n=2 Tax=Macrostomum lignano TaxID=282301 RepID=A0A267F2U3_9PLAT|nr:hypothetical protein BOX15_Mlig006729g2 [Macrostomum lignano]